MVIRDAVIRIRTEMPTVSASEAAYKREAAAAREAASAQREATKAAQEHDQFNVKSIQSFAKAAQGALQLTRAVALLGLTSEESSQKMLQGLLAVESGVSAVRGAYALLSSKALAAAAVALGPVNLGILAVGAALTAGFAIWKRWGDSAAEAAQKAAMAARETAREYANVLQRVEELTRAERGRRLADEAFASETAIVPSAKRFALKRQIGAVTGELESAERRREQLAAPLPPGTAPNVVAGTTRQLVEAEKTSLELVRERARLEQELLQFRIQEREAQLRANPGGITGFQNLLGGAFLDAAARRGADADIKKFEQEAQETINNLNAVFERVNRALIKHEHALQSLER